MKQDETQRRHGQQLLTATASAAIPHASLNALTLETPRLDLPSRQTPSRLHVWDACAFVLQGDAAAGGDLRVVGGHPLLLNYYDNADNLLFCMPIINPSWPIPTVIYGHSYDEALFIGKTHAADTPICEVEPMMTAAGLGIGMGSALPPTAQTVISRVSLSMSILIENTHAVNDHSAVGYVGMVYSFEL